MVCFEKRLGAMSGGEAEAECQALIESNKKIFLIGGQLKFALPFFKLITTPKWKQLVAAEDFFYGYESPSILHWVDNLINL